MIAYKFLRAGAIGSFSGFAWPRPGPHGPGPWVEAAPFRGACGVGIHGCDGDHLVYWLDRELWLVELGGEVAAAQKKLIAPRGRLVRRIEAWDEPLQRELAEAGIARARELAEAAESRGEAEAALARGYLADTILFSPIDVGAGLFCAAHAALSEDGFARERTWQSRWLAARLATTLAPEERPA
jgi:hypothetical protein